MGLRQLTLAGLLVTAGCVPIPTPAVATLEHAPSAELDPLEVGEAVAVMSSRDGATRFIADCVRKDLAGGLRQNRVLTEDEARDAFFPWLEPSQMPRTDEQAQTFITRPAVAAKLQDLRLRYLVVVDVTSSESEGQGGEALFAGAAFLKASARAGAQVVDLAGGCCRPGGVADATGIQGYAHVMIYGFIVLSSVEQAACDRLSAALVEELRPAATKSRPAKPSAD
jgi:hypothetical protein